MYRPDITALVDWAWKTKLLTISHLIYLIFALFCDNVSIRPSRIVSCDHAASWCPVSEFCGHPFPFEQTEWWNAAPCSTRAAHACRVRFPLRTREETHLVLSESCLFHDLLLHNSRHQVLDERVQALRKERKQWLIRLIEFYKWFRLCGSRDEELGPYAQKGFCYPAGKRYPGGSYRYPLHGAACCCPRRSVLHKSLETSHWRKNAMQVALTKWGAAHPSDSNVRADVRADLWVRRSFAEYLLVGM